MAKEKVQPTKVTELYNGKIKVAFYEKSHRYIVNDKDRPLSVTACTGIIDKSRPLIYWAIGLAKDYLNTIKPGQITPLDIEEAGKQHTIRKEAAATSGSKVHAWAEQCILFKLKRIKELPEMPKEKAVRLGVMAFLKWVDERKIKFLDTEKLVYSKKYKFVGILDCTALIKGKKYIVDFKTSKNVYPEMFFQIAGYRGADEEESGIKYDGSIIAHFSKDTGDFKTHPTEDHKKDYKAFLSCLNLKNRLKELDK